MSVGSLTLSLLQPLRKWAWKQLTLGEHSGICIVDTSRAKAGRQVFLRRTMEALELLRRADARRFKRVCSQLRYIVHRELAFAYGQYNARLAACYVDFTRLDFSKDPNRTLWCYAAILVHEATHGSIHRHRVPYSPGTRERVERLCNIETARFLRRYTRSAGDLWEQIMNRPGRRPRAWRATRWQRLGALWKRRSETARMTNPQGGANGRQPFSSGTNRAPAAAASRRSP
jgi:hypothetical protein